MKSSSSGFCCELTYNISSSSVKKRHKHSFNTYATNFSENSLCHHLVRKHTHKDIPNMCHTINYYQVHYTTLENSFIWLLYVPTYSHCKHAGWFFDEQTNCACKTIIND